jgi:serine/threonine protein kinase
MKKLQPREREDAVNEIRIMASIKHKNIVRYCDAFLEKDNLYIAMEFAGEETTQRTTVGERGREGGNG